jgi:YD repeat-containing protein
MAAPVNWLLPLMLAMTATVAPAQPAPPAQAATVDGQTRTLLPDGRLLIVGGTDSRGRRADVIVQDRASGTLTRIHAPALHGRAWHTATVLPDGGILILGGVGARSEFSPPAQILDPATGHVSPVHATFAPRARHSTTLLTDGTVLIAGGTDRHGLVTIAERWDPFTGAVLPLDAPLLSPRSGHEAVLTSEGSVLIRGGRGANGEPALDEAFHPETGAFAPAPADDSPVGGAALAASVPAHGDADVPLGARIALRFSGPLLMASVTGATVRLEGPAGPVAADVIAAEGGRLVFLHSRAALTSGTAYLVHIDGVTDAQGQVVPFTSVAFVTAGGRPDVGADFSEEAWRPTAEHHRDNWRLGQPESPWSRLPALKAGPGLTAVSGQVLALNGRPLADVTLAIGDRNVTSDRTGRFLLLLRSSGSQTLLIDGRTAGDAGRRFGVFHTRLWVREGETNVLPFAIWLPRTDTAHAVRLSGPLDRDLVVTTPLIPGLEVHIPKGSIVRDHEGRPATEVSITPIPVDRPPFPLPTGVSVPVYFTIQPGGGFIESPGKPWPEGARVVYPNYTYERPGTRLNFWNYDPEERGWHVYGMGAVDPSGLQVMPDRGVVLYRFTGTMINFGLTPPGPYPPPGWWPWGDPIDPSTGLFVLTKTDLFLPDVIPLALTRTYRQNDTASRPFGIGATHPYAMFLWSAQQYQEVDLILPDGGRVHYVRISPGTGFGDAEFEHTGSPTRFQKSRIKYNTGNAAWDLTLTDGTVYVFGDMAPLQEIRDRFGNRVTLTWSGQNGGGQGTGNLVRVTSPNRFLEFTYDGSDRITEAKDNSGRTVGYEYDASGRLWKVTDANGGVTEYTYDASHRLLTIKDARGIVYLTNEYDANGRVVRQTQADNTTYEMAYTLDGSGRVAQADLTNPRGQAERLTFNTSGYVTTHVQAVGTSLERTTTFTRQSGTNLLTSVTDPLSRQTDYSYDTMGNLTSVTRLAGTVDALTTSMTHEPTFNLVASLTDPLSQVRTFTYDSLGRLTAATDPLTNQTTFTYNEAGQVLTITTPANETTLLAYPFGDLASVTTPLGHVEQRFVDTAGRIVQYTDASGARTRFEYSPLNQVTKIIDPLGGETTFTYDGNGNLLTLTDARGKTTTWTYDALDRVATRTDPLNRQETFVVRREWEPGRMDGPQGAGDQLRVRSAGSADVRRLRDGREPADLREHDRDDLRRRRPGRRD